MYQAEILIIVLATVAHKVTTMKPTAEGLEAMASEKCFIHETCQSMWTAFVPG